MGTCFEFAAAIMKHHGTSYKIESREIKNVVPAKGK
jgi:hypothetical protein